MEQRDLMEAHVQLKRMNHLLNEVMDITKQLAEAMDRDDPVSIRMLIGMREEPIERLKLADQALRRQCEGQQRLAELLRGGAAQTEAETPLANQVDSNRRLLREVRELDEVLSRKLAREDSFYNN